MSSSDCGFLKKRHKGYCAAAALAVAVAAVALFTTAAAQTAVGEWDTSLPDLPADPRHHPITFTLGDTGYVMMGTTRADIFAYNASSASWAAPRLRSGLPPWREFAYGVSVGGGAFGETAAEQVAFLGLGRAGSSVPACVFFIFLALLPRARTCWYRQPSRPVLASSRSVRFTLKSEIWALRDLTHPSVSPRTG